MSDEPDPSPPAPLPYPVLRDRFLALVDALMVKTVGWTVAVPAAVDFVLGTADCPTEKPDA